MADEAPSAAAHPARTARLMPDPTPNDPTPSERPASGQILIADRDPLQRQLVDMLFAVDDFELVGVDSGRAALDYLKRATPVLAILAVDLPDIDGPSICTRMKSVARLTSVPVILVAEARQRLGVDETTRAVARDAGAGLLLQKPLGDKNLRERALRLMAEGGAAPPGGRPAGSARADLRSTAALDETPPRTTEAHDGATRVAALESENRELRERIDRLEAELARLRPERARSDDARKEETRDDEGDERRPRRPGGRFRRR